jgi:lipopolysaccharide biosynthesis glycosyltransferase
MTKRTAIIFTTDAGFTMPTMSVVLQLLAQPEVIARADILIYLVDIEADQKQRLDESFAGLPLRFIEIPADLLALPDSVRFNRTHVPRSTLARLSLGTLIPRQYANILYLDGDIQVLGDILPLVTHEVGEGRIASVNEAVWMYEGDGGKYWPMMRDYLAGIGLRTPLDYFNAGVLAFRRSTWETASAEALDFFLRHSDLCTFHDQSALNAVFNGKREILSPIYNYSSGYADLGLERRLMPRLVHFTGAAKPWFSTCRPWNGRFLPHYAELIRQYPVLATFGTPKTQQQIAAIEREVATRRRRMMLTTPWRPALRRQKLLRYMTATGFVC